MDLFEIHNRLFFLANKEQNFWTREEIDMNLHMAQMWKFNDSLPNYAVDQKVQEALAPFKVTHTFTTGDTPNGLITFDVSQYLHFLGLYTQFYDNRAGRVDYNPVRIVNEDELGGRLKSQLKPVTLQKPIATVTGLGKYQLYPQSPNTGKAFYLEAPVAPVFVYTQAGRVQTYDPGASTQMVWNETCINEIIMKALQLLGVNIQDGKLVNYTEQKDQQKT